MDRRGRRVGGSPAHKHLGELDFAAASCFVIHLTTSISLLASIPYFVVGGDGAGRGKARPLATRRAELFNHDALGNWTLLLLVAS